MIYQNEIKKSLEWLYNTQNKENFGWSWIRDISPNEQNTAEVVYASLLFSDILTDSQIKLLNKATEQWLVMPNKHAVLTIDWVWVGLALSKYLEKYDEIQARIDQSFIREDIAKCVETVLSLQNEDGGWGDYKNDLSTLFRTSITIIFLLTQIQVRSKSVDEAIEKGITFLLDHQNEDGGFGNISNKKLDKNILSIYTGIEQEIIENQFLSSLSATGYALWALSTYNKYYYSREIDKAIEFVKSLNLKNNYEIFLEVGIRRGTLFTFRHFGAAWIGIGLLSTGKLDFTSEPILNLIKHFLKLQDQVNGGFRCDFSSEAYTWSECNALMFLRLAIDSLDNLNGLEYTDIIAEYFIKKNS